MHCLVLCACVLLVMCCVEWNDLGLEEEGLLVDLALLPINEQLGN